MKIKNLNPIKYFLITIFISTNIFASSYCLNRMHSLFTVKKELKSILITGEDVLIDTKSNCMEIAVRPYREQLISKYIRMNYKIDSYLTKSVSITKDMCKFKLKKVDSRVEEKKKIEIGKNIDVSKSNFVNKSESIQDIVVMENRVATISMNADKLYVKCNKNVDTISVDISLDRDFTTVLSTVVTVSASEWFDLASIKNDLTNRSKVISIPNGVRTVVTDGNQSSDYFLKVD